MEIGVEGFEGAEEVFEPGDGVVGGDFALQGDGGSADFEGLLDAPADALDGGVVVDSAIDCVTYDPLGVQAAADGIGFHADADQIVTVETVQSFLAANSHRLILRTFLAKIWRGGMVFNRVF